MCVPCVAHCALHVVFRIVYCMWRAAIVYRVVCMVHGVLSTYDAYCVLYIAYCVLRIVFGILYIAYSLTKL